MGALHAGAHVFWVYAAILAGIILLVIYLTGGFGAGSDLPNSLDASGSGAALAKEASERGRDSTFEVRRGTASTPSRSE